MPPLSRLAWLNVISHALGLVFAAAFMAPGTPLASIEDRVRFLAETPAMWKAGWCVWILCAAALLAFLGRIAAVELADSGLAKIGMMFAITAIGFDLACDSMYIAVLPSLAETADRAFLPVERITGMVSLTVANGLYTTGVLCVNEAIPRDRARRGTRVLGWLVGVFGGLMAIAGITGDPWLTAIATGPTMAAFCLWTLFAARRLERTESAP